MAVYEIQDFEIENFARNFLPEMRAFFASEEGNAEYEKWLSEQEHDISENENLKKTDEINIWILATYSFMETIKASSDAWDNFYELQKFYAIKR